VKAQSSLILLCVQRQHLKLQTRTQQVKINQDPYLAHIQTTFLNQTFDGKYILPMTLTFARFDGR
jgi:hypothetical protein